MGQSASKGLSKAAEKAARQAPAKLKRPPIPSRVPRTQEASAQNPESFLRGQGIGAQDLRDRGQEMYLQHAQQQRQQQQQQQQQAADATGSSPSDNKVTTTPITEMPEDLLKFIQDVGPARQSVDRDFTTSRLLKEEHSDELNKAESARTAKRERVRMPLMQGDDNFTTEKNTNFSVGDVSASVADEHDFGLSNLQLYDLMVASDAGVDDAVDVDAFHEKAVSDNREDEGRPDPPSAASLKEAEKSKAKELALLSQTLEVLEIPALRMNADGDILGLYKNDVPGPEMTTITTIPEDKIIMVLKDLSINGKSNMHAERTPTGH